MTVPLVTALHATETLKTFHLEREVDSSGETGEYHLEMARRCAEDAENITNAILASGVTVEHQADAARRRDLETAQRIIDRHFIMHGVGDAGRRRLRRPVGHCAGHCGRPHRSAGRDGVVTCPATCGN